MSYFKTSNVINFDVDTVTSTPYFRHRDAYFYHFFKLELSRDTSGSMWLLRFYLRVKVVVSWLMNLEDYVYIFDR